MQQPIPKEFLLQVFPFYFAFDERLSFVHGGHSFSKLAENVSIGTSIFDFLELQRPQISAISIHSIIENQRSIFVFRLLSSKIDLKGQIVYSEVDNLFFFLGSPAVKEANELIKNRLTLNDFALHDNTMEFLFILQAYQNQLNMRLADKNKELEHKQHEIEAQNEELKQQREEILSINERLEELVVKRTEELHKTIDNLYVQNQNLEQFSYIVSHNIRSPIARIMGLLQLFDYQNINNSFNIQVLQYIDECANNLNNIIADLSEIISIRKNLEKNKEYVALQANAESILESLKSEIIQTNAKITIESKGIDTIFSIKAYLQSILYNLVSNALKYKSPLRTPQITIVFQQVKGNLEIIVRDNGIGIDLENISEYQIFGLYKRVHNHVEGKGLGLYLVKTQVEALNGKIELTSTLGEGTTFTVTLPI
jgi:signal transduction histidine kinase